MCVYNNRVIFEEIEKMISKYYGVTFNKYNKQRHSEVLSMTRVNKRENYNRRPIASV